MQVTVSPTPDPQVSVTFQVDELGINETETTVAGVATFSIASVTATNNSIWDATIQVGANMRAAASAQAVETNGDTTVGVTITSGEVTYCAPTAGGGGSGTVTSITAGSGLTGGTITSTGTIAHGPGTFVGSEEYPVKIVVDSFGHIQVNESESTAGAYRTAVGADDADNLTSGTVAIARGGTGSATAPMIGVVTAADAAAAQTALQLGTAATKDVGTGGQNVVQLDNASRLPAVDGSQLTNLPGGGGGGGSAGVQWGQAPQTVVRLFEDFGGGEETTTGDGWWAGDTAGNGAIKRQFMGSEGADTFGRMALDTNSGTGSTNDWAQMTSGIVSRVIPVTGDEIIWECNVSLEASSATTGDNLCAISIFDPVASGWNNDGLGWHSNGASTPPNRIVLGSIGGEANWRYAITESNVEDLTGSSSDTGVAVTFDENVFARLAIKLVKTSTSNEWTYNVYVAGNSVGTGTFTTAGQLACQVIQQASDSTSNDMGIDWMSLQYTRPTVNHISHSDSGDPGTVADSYTGQIETAADKTYTIDPRVAADRTISYFYGRSSTGTCTAKLYNGSDLVATLSVTSSSSTALLDSNYVAVSENGAITLVISSNVGAENVVFAVEYTQ